MVHTELRPSALIVGAQKAGTTAMLRNICKHPDILGTITELDFFTDKWSRGSAWYSEALFKSISKSDKYKDGIFLIEKSPSYLSNPDAAHRIFEYNPTMKIIICLRNPVDRAFSRYNDILVDQPERLKKTFAQIVESGLNKPNHFLENGLYAPQVTRYFELFGRENVKVVIQERWKAAPYDTIADVVRFLGFDDLPVFEVQSVHTNPYKDGMDAGVRSQLENYFSGANEELFNLLGARILEWETK